MPGHSDTYRVICILVQYYKRRLGSCRSACFDCNKLILMKLGVELGCFGPNFACQIQPSSIANVPYLAHDPSTTWPTWLHLNPGNYARKTLVILRRLFNGLRVQ